MRIGSAPSTPPRESRKPGRGLSTVEAVLTTLTESPVPPPAVSFVVIAHNEQAGIRNTLRSILAQAAAARHIEVVVVDDGSTDATPAIVRDVADRDPRVRLVRLAENRGRGPARAEGIRAVRGGLVAMVDADIVLPPQWLERCLDAIACADAVAGVAVPDGDVTYLHHRFGLVPKVRSHATDVTGSNALYRAELFDDLTFDVRLRDGEDVAFSHSLRERRASVRTVPGLVVRHEERKGLRRSLRWMFQSGRGAARQLYRYRELRRPDAVFAGWLAACGAGWAARGRPAVALALPLGYLTAASTAHVGGAFVVERRRAGRFVGAVAVDMALLAAYFGGRAAGAVLCAPVRAGSDARGEPDARRESRCDGA